MSAYANTLATARLSALRTLVNALHQADSPEEKRRCAVAIFNAPDPSDLDDEIEFDDESEDEDKEQDAEDTDQSEDDADSEEEEDSENQPTTLNPAPPPSPLPTSEIRHRPSDIPLPCTCDRCRVRHHVENTAQLQPLPVIPTHPSPASMLIATAGRAP